jgi:hypothetical protein
MRLYFFNHTETLGNYGLFFSPGELAVINALTIDKARQGSKVSFGDIKIQPDNRRNNTNNFPFPCFDHPFWDEMVYRYFKSFQRYGLPFLNLPFLSNSALSLNVYDFIRNWSLFNIGEVASVSDHIIDGNLSQITRLLLRQAGLSNLINLNVEGQEQDSNLTVITAHLSMDE